MAGRGRRVEDRRVGGADRGHTPLAGSGTWLHVGEVRS